MLKVVPGALDNKRCPRSQGRSPRKKKCKKAKCLSEEALQIAEKRRDAKGKGEKGILECRIPKNSKER